jgi:hypothetical protein
VTVKLHQTPGLSAPLGRVALPRVEVWLWKSP